MDFFEVMCYTNKVVLADTVQRNGFAARIWRLRGAKPAKTVSCRGVAFVFCPHFFQKG